MPHSGLDKNTLRARYLGARKNIPAPQARAAAESLAGHLLAHLPAAPAIVAGYNAIHNEISLSPAFESLHARGQRLCLPVVMTSGQPLIFREWKPGDAVEVGAYGIDIPLSSAPELVPDIVIVPLAAFDLGGHRLGYGAGYYDKTIPILRERRKNVRIVGVAYSQQQVERIPVDEHDQRLDAVATERGWMEFA